MPSPQGKIWMLTIPMADWHPESLPDNVVYLRGQGEEGGTTGYRHWQMLAVFERSVRLSAVKSAFCNSAHCELTRSSRADDYVWKDDTAIIGTRFELGEKPLKRNSKKDWQKIWDLAVAGSILEIDPGIRLQHYRNLCQISADFAQPLAIERKVIVFHGPTGTGKSRRAWEEAGWEAYPKDPRTKFWCSYRGEKHVVIDEFRGGIDIAHLLRWCDRYPVIVEVKGYSAALRCEKIWITSNLHPTKWYPELDLATVDALLRRLEIIEIL